MWQQNTVRSSVRTCLVFTTIVLVRGSFYDSPRRLDCFGTLCQHGGTLDKDNCTCVCPTKYTGFECETVAESTSKWPNDNFGIPENIYGCPEPNDPAWRRAFVNLTVSDDWFSADLRQYWPDLPTAYRGPWHRRMVQINFCVREKIGDANADDEQWPPGDYCVYMTHPCRSGLIADTMTLQGYTKQEGTQQIPDFLKLDDNTTSVHLSVCCMINLPTNSKEFVNSSESLSTNSSELFNSSGSLLTNSSELFNSSESTKTTVKAFPLDLRFTLLKSQISKGCQELPKFVVKEEWFSFLATPTVPDSERLDFRRLGTSLVRMGYCVYEKYERRECAILQDRGSSYRGRKHTTRSKYTCLPWAENAKEKYRHLEKNYCYPLFTSGTLFCYIHRNDGRVKRSKCSRDDCDPSYDQRGRIPNVARFKLLEANGLQTNLGWIADGFERRTDSADGINHMYDIGPYEYPWIQIDLAHTHEVHGVFMIRYPFYVTPPYDWINVAVWIHSERSDFHSFGARLCWQIQDVLEVEVLLLECYQPINGRYVTIQPYANASLGYRRPEISHFQLSELAVYGYQTYCNQLLGILVGEIRDAFITNSNGDPADMFRLTHANGSCVTDGYMLLEVDLLVPIVLQGFWLRMSGTSSANVTVTARRTLSTGDFTLEQGMEVTGHEDHIERRHYLPRRLYGRWVTLEIHFQHQHVCMKFDLIGCRKRIHEDPYCDEGSEYLGLEMTSADDNLPSEDFFPYTSTNESLSDHDCMQQCSKDNRSCLSFLHLLDDMLQPICRTWPFPLLTLTEKSPMPPQNNSITGRKICAEGVHAAHECEYTLHLTGMTHLTSPNYPNYYGEFLRCIWRIVYPPNTPVQVTILDIDLAVPDTSRLRYQNATFEDVLTMHDGRTTERKYGPDLVIGHRNQSRYSNSTIYFYNSTVVTISLLTNRNSGPGKGFSLRIQPAECFGHKRQAYQKYGDDKSAEFKQIHWAEDHPGACGFVSSPNFPSPYLSNITMYWLIVTPIGLKYEFLHFDVPAGNPEKCSEGYVRISEFEKRDTSDMMKWEYERAAKFCNLKRPVGVMYSRTHIIEIRFTTGMYRVDQGTGFLLKWTPLELADNNLLEALNYTGIQADYDYLLRANGIEVNETTEQHFGENFCRGMDRFSIYRGYPHKCYDHSATAETLSSDTSDSSEQANVTISYPVIDSSIEEAYLAAEATTRPNHLMYIGQMVSNRGFDLVLNPSNTGVNISKYRNWGHNEKSFAPEPDHVGELRCIKLERDKSSKYFWAVADCNEDFKDSTFTQAVPLQLPWRVSQKARAPVETPGETNSMLEHAQFHRRLFQCDNAEYILSQYQCDGYSDCTDQTDEHNCETVCGPSRFDCGSGDDGGCISMDLRCDFYKNCKNGADEAHCVYFKCSKDEWRCDNGQCIPDDNYGDKKVDCIDASDEIPRGNRWRLDLLGNQNRVFGQSTSRLYVNIYGENMVSGEIPTEPPNDLTSKTRTVWITLDLTTPRVIRIRNAFNGHDSGYFSRVWSMSKATLTLEKVNGSAVSVDTNNREFTFPCTCDFNRKTLYWDVKSGDRSAAIKDNPRYTVTLRTGQRSGAGTSNHVYVILYGQTYSTHIDEFFDEDHIYSAGTELKISRKLIYLGKLAMVRIILHGEQLHDSWLLDTVKVTDSVNNVVLKFHVNRWMNMSIDNSENVLTLMAENTTEPIYSAKRCQGNKFKCFDGTCIPRSFFCDKVVHCRGPLHEDEPLMCLSTLVQPMCLDHVRQGELADAVYVLTLGSNTRASEQKCVLDASKENVLTEVRHSLTNRIYIYNTTLDMELDYDNMDIDTIDRLMALSETCTQEIEIECYHLYEAQLHLLTWEDKSRRTRHFYPNSSTECLDNSTSNGCNCRRSLLQWYSDHYREFHKDTFVISDKSLLPIQHVQFGEFEDPTKLRVVVGPLVCSQSLSKAPAYKCRNKETYDPQYRCKLHLDQYGRSRGCLDFSHLDDCETFECPGGYLKCPDSYCIPKHYQCNGVSDCTNGEDELGCTDEMRCIGALLCKGSGICVSGKHVCDGERDCPQGDDEYQCVHNSQYLKTLKYDGPGTNLSNDYFRNFPMVASLNLSGIHLKSIESNLFKGLKNVITLDLTNNNIEIIESGAFKEMRYLRYILLDENYHIQTIGSGAFSGLKQIKNLRITDAKLKAVLVGMFDGLESLLTLKLTNNLISTLENRAFSALKSLTELDLRGNPISQFASGIFFGLNSLTDLFSDFYHLCCIRPSSVEESRCIPGKDVFSSCEDLMKNTVLRILLWTVGMFALLGNIMAMLFRIVYERRSFKTGNGMLLSNLCASDFLMGLYMIIIAGADITFKGRYVWNDMAWRASWMCKFAGVIAFVATEASGIFLCFITIDRLLTFRFTLQKSGFTQRSALCACAVTWAVCVLLGTLPLWMHHYFDQDFYTRTGVCIALPLTTDRRGGWEFATIIFVFLNLLVFIFIAVGQALIFREIRGSLMETEKSKRRDDLTIARKLFLVVVSNFMCWIPICILGLVALAGHPLDGEVYAWIVAFVLPLNSAINPVLYTLSSIGNSLLAIQIKKLLRIGNFNNPNRERIETRALGRISENGSITLILDPGLIPITSYLHTKNLTTLEILSVARMLAENLNMLHNLGYILGPFTEEDVYVKQAGGNGISRVCMVAMPLMSDRGDDISLDMGNLGIVLKRIIAKRDARKQQKMQANGGGIKRKASTKVSIWGRFSLMRRPGKNPNN